VKYAIPQADNKIYSTVYTKCYSENKAKLTPDSEYIITITNGVMQMSFGNL